MIKGNVKFRLLIASLLSGLLLSLAWMGMSGLVLLFAFIPLLYVDHYIDQHREGYLPVVFWMYALLAFLVWNGLTTWWIGYATIAGAIFAIVINSFLMALVWWLVHVVRRWRGDRVASIFLVVSWLSFEYLHFHWELSWPWLTLGNGFANDIHLIQWYEYTGVFGGSLWVLLTNLVLWKLLKSYNNDRIKRMQWLLMVSLVFIPVVISLVQFFTYKEWSDPVNVVLAQPNIDPYHDKFDRMSYGQQTDCLIEMADSLGSDQVDLFVGPETALHEVWQSNIMSNLSVRRIHQMISEKYPQAAFITGAMTYRRYPSVEDASATARFNVDSSLIYDGYNSSLFISGSGCNGMYHKSKLVPGVEKLPFQKYLKFMDHFIVDLGGTTGSLATDYQISVFKQDNFIAGVPICYESVFGEYVSQFVRKGANILVVITNDGWWHNSIGYQQHFSYSRLLSVSLRRSIARAGNTGISGFINQRGEVEQHTAWWVQTALLGQINRNSRLTFYAQHGDYIGRTGVYLFVLMGLLLLVEILKRKSLTSNDEFNVENLKKEDNK